jgi:hypothetical protein
MSPSICAALEVLQLSMDLSKVTRCPSDAGRSGEGCLTWHVRAWRTMSVPSVLVISIDYLSSCQTLS